MEVSFRVSFPKTTFKKCSVNKKFLKIEDNINNKMVEISWGGYNLLEENNKENIKANAYV